MSITSVSYSRFKELVRKGERPRVQRLQKDYATTFETGGSRELRFSISTPTPDRENDVVSLEGWQLARFRTNPVVLWQHNRDLIPIAKAVSVEIEGGRLKATVQFQPSERGMIGQMADEILGSCQDGFLSATSVGFIPLAFEVANDRDDDADSWFPPMNFLEQELLEFSIVTVPCNAECLIEPPDVIAVTDLPGNAQPDPALSEARAQAEALERAQADLVLAQLDADRERARIQRVMNERARRAFRISLATAS